MGHWFRHGLAELFEDEVLAHDARTGGLLDQAAVHALWREHQAEAADHGPRLWTLLNLEHWLRACEAPTSMQLSGASTSASAGAGM
jgi:Asparagine synthase